MSAPTKGMVAGKAIKTDAQSKEWDEGFDRTFGERKAGRGRYRWNPETQAMESLSNDWTDTERRAPTPTEELTYGNLRATDGTDISSRTKHRRYMQANNLSLASDFKEHWPRAQAERQRILSGEADTKERKEILGRALYETKRGRR